MTAWSHNIFRIGSPLNGGVGRTVGATGQHSFKSTIGHHLAPVVMSNGGDLWDKLGSYFTLIELTGNSGGVAKFDAAATSRGIPLNVLEIEDPGLREAYDVEAILVRPDDFIAWSGSIKGADAGGILTGLSVHKPAPLVVSPC